MGEAGGPPGGFVLPIQQSMMSLQVPGGAPDNQPPSQYQPVQMSHLQNQVNKINTLYSKEDPPHNPFETAKHFQDFNPPTGKSPSRDDPMRRSSKSKMNMLQAKEIDQNLNIGGSSNPPQQDPGGGGFMQFG